MANPELMRLLMLILFSAVRLLGDATPALDRPVTALAVQTAPDGDRLLIGQGTMLTEAALVPDDLQPGRTLDLKHGAIRSILSQKDGLLVLSEDGLTALDANWRQTDFVPGGGQRLAMHGNLVYMAALEAGVRLYMFEGGRFKRLPVLQTTGPAEDIAPEGATWLWVAEGAHGLRLYDLTNPAAPSLIAWTDSLVPAHLVRVYLTQLFLGYGSRLALLDTTNFKAPRMVSDIALGGDTTFAGDLVRSQSLVAVGRIATSGADVLLFDYATPRAPREVGHTGTDGGGESLALRGTDLFSGSERAGLRRTAITPDSLTEVRAWAAIPDSLPCDQQTPVNPQPANLGEWDATGPLILRWTAQCPAASYEIRVEGQTAGRVTGEEFTLVPRGDVINWQVIALDRDGQPAAEGPRWTFEIRSEGWSADPKPLRLDNLLYRAPPVLIAVDTPGGLLLASCASLAIGLLVIVLGALAISAWAERRERS